MAGVSAFPIIVNEDLIRAKPIKQVITPVDIVYSSTDDYSIDTLIEQEKRLNAAKDLMDKHYTNEESRRAWEKVMRVRDPYAGGLRHKLSHLDFIVTNATLKYNELLTQFYRPNGPQFAFMNAELPGAALTMYAQWMAQRYPATPMEWRASSYMPAQDDGTNTALGDTYGIYQNNKSHWMMSPDNDGDMTNIDNIRDIADRIGPASKLGGCTFYSHDAGIGVADDGNGGLGFNSQEELNARLHLGCAIMGFMSMRPGATFIAKQYSMFKTLTWNLIMMYAPYFQQLYVCKPETSRPFNSECYIVGIGYLGMPQDVLDIMINRLINFNMRPMFPFDESHRDTISQIVAFSRMVYDRQTATIINNVEMFEKYSFDQLNRALSPIRESIQEEWLKKYPLHAVQAKLITTKKSNQGRSKGYTGYPKSNNRNQSQHTSYQRHTNRIY